MKAGAPVEKDLVLVGGGHAHLFVLEAFAMRPEPGVRLTVVTRDVHTPYSGMLPGFIAGHYAYDDVHVDLRPLAHAAGARLFHDEVTGIDRAGKRVLCAARPPVPYDLLSLDVGSRPRRVEVPGAEEHAVAVKPIDRLAARWEALRARVRAGPLPFRLAMVGGGAAGVEVLLAAQHRLREDLAGAGRDPEALETVLVTGGALLPSHPARVARIFGRVLGERGVRVLHRRVARVEAGRLRLEGGESVAFDEVFWATQAGGAPWLAASGLPCGPEGFVKVDETLQVAGEPAIFAAGDVADVVAHPRPKAGVFAVRQGPPLAKNLRAVLRGGRPAPFAPQKRFLTLIGTGDRRAVASKGPFALAGAWAWRWKDRIDRRFMERFRDRADTDMDAGAEPGPGRGVGRSDGAARRGGGESRAGGIRCGGCGAKVGSTILARVLARLAAEAEVDGETARADGVVVGLEAPDDAAVVRPPPGRVLVQTVDFFRAFLDDPYVFGRVAAVHALGDVYAMGAEPRTALAIAAVPHASEKKVEDALYQMMAGALSVFRAEGVALVGGHSTEGAEAALGFSVEGSAEEGALLRKTGGTPGDSLVLTKAIGTGVLFAADMRGKAKGRWIDAALASMQRSPREAAGILRAHGATACTDVSGFGLAGHLLEMVRTAKLAADLHLSAVPFLDGALELAREGVRSTLYEENARAAGFLREACPGPAAGDVADPRFDLLLDPQTAGGLLAAVPSDRAEGCARALRAAGEAAAVVGRLREGDPGEPLRLHD